MTIDELKIHLDIRFDKLETKISAAEFSLKEKIRFEMGQALMVYLAEIDSRRLSELDYLDWKQKFQILDKITHAK